AVEGLHGTVSPPAVWVGLEEGGAGAGHTPALQSHGELADARLDRDGGPQQVVLAVAADLVPGLEDGRRGNRIARPGDRVATCLGWQRRQVLTFPPAQR